MFSFIHIMLVADNLPKALEQLAPVICSLVGHVWL